MADSRGMLSERGEEIIRSGVICAGVTKVYEWLKRCCWYIVFLGKKW